MPFVVIENWNCPLGSFVIFCGATLSTPVIAMKSCAAGLFDEAVAVVVDIPFALLAAAEVTVMTSFGGFCGVVGGVAGGVVGGTGPGGGHVTGAGTGLPGQGDS